MKTKLTTLFKWLGAALILTAIALPPLIDQDKRSAMAAIRHDLHVLHSKQLLYYRQHGTYSTDIASLDFSDSSTVHIVITRADAECYHSEGYQNKYFKGYLSIDCSGKLKKHYGSGNNPML